MRFITEFNIEDYHAKDNFASKAISGRQNMLQSDMGDMLADSFGWQNPVNGNNLHYRLEIEAFPMDKWVEFKQKLFMECGMPEPNGVAILEMIKDLEFYANNKQAVDAITNQQLNK